jgi:hypothetical protein
VRNPDLFCAELSHSTGVAKTALAGAAVRVAAVDDDGLRRAVPENTSPRNLNRRGFDIVGRENARNDARLLGSQDSQILGGCLDSTGYACRDKAPRGRDSASYPFHA